MPKPRKQPPATPAPSPTASEPLAWIRQDLRALARPISTLAHDPRNARKHGSENLRSLTASLRAHGQVKPLVVRQGVVIAGNGTLEAARALGWSHLACVEFAGSDLEARAFAIADNRTAELATWDDAILAESLRDLDDAGFLNATGFDEPSMAQHFEDAAERAAGEVPEEKPAPYSRKIECPIYEPRGVKPPVSALFDTSRADALKTEIEKADVPEDVRAFLLRAADRHVVFDYEEIAEFYSHATAPLRKLMEDSALVIVDFNRAIELGFVKLTKDLVDAYEAQGSEGFDE